jgi:hypothetical protein
VKVKVKVNKVDFSHILRKINKKRGRRAWEFHTALPFQIGKRKFFFFGKYKAPSPSSQAHLIGSLERGGSSGFGYGSWATGFQHRE